jgi:hypothetical protein
MEFWKKNIWPETGMSFAVWICQIWNAHKSLTGRLDQFDSAGKIPFFIYLQKTEGLMNCFKKFWSLPFVNVLLLGWKSSEIRVPRQPCGCVVREVWHEKMSDKDGDNGRMSKGEKVLIFRSKKDRRSGIERRQFSYAGHIPERRMDQERRSGSDRRHGGMM